MTELSMGASSEIPKKDNLHNFSQKSMKAHTFITGQSGCGKSSLMARLVEEIILKDAGNVLLFDYNFEFTNFDQIDRDAFEAPYSKEKVNFESRNVQRSSFENEWGPLKDDFILLKSDSIYIPYKEISSDQKANLFGIDQDKDAGAYWLIQFLGENAEISSRIKGKKTLKILNSDLDRWFEGRLKKEDDKLGEFIHQIKQHVNMLELTKYQNNINRLLQPDQQYIKFRADSKKISLNSKFFKSFFNDLKFCSIDMMNYDYKYYPIRDFIALHILNGVWHQARERYKEVKAAGTLDDLRPLYLVIDEAHNIIPQKMEHSSVIAMETVKLLKTIAAEGRKFGLFLILISQRPNKIDENVLSECDNFIVMKSTPPTIKKLQTLLPLEEKDQKELDKAFRFGTGEAFYNGKITGYDIQKVYGDIRRTLT